jgi:hypothetical protein
VRINGLNEAAKPIKILGGILGKQLFWLMGGFSMFEDSALWVIAGVMLLFAASQGGISLGGDVLGLGVLGLLGFVIIGEAQHH